MEFAAQKLIKRGDIWTIDLPNLKEWCYVPNRIEFWTNKQASSGTNSNSKNASDVNSGPDSVSKTLQVPQ